MRKNNLDIIALIPGANFRRLFKCDFHLMERPLLVIIPIRGLPVAIIPFLELDAFKKIQFEGEIFFWKDEIGYENAFEKASKLIPKIRLNQRFGVEGQRMRVFEQIALQKVFPDSQFIDAHKAISSIRLVKTDFEIKQLRQAISISEIALQETLSTIKIGQTEKQIETNLIKYLFAHGAQGLSFDPIVAAGKNSSKPHASARYDYKIKKGDALLIDFGATWNGYNADITRTFFVQEVSAYNEELYDTVLKANKCGRVSCEPGCSAGKIDDRVQTILENSRFREFIRHKTGHGLGLDVHEDPQIMRSNHQIIERGMVFTIEPGLYRTEECGVRIEDNVVMTEAGVRCLTNFGRHLQIIP